MQNTLSIHQTKKVEQINTSLSRAKAHGISLICSDWDETLADRDNPKTKTDAVRLISDVILKGKKFCILSARGVSLRLEIDNVFRNEAKKRNHALSLYISGGNGASLEYITFHPDESISTQTLHETPITHVDVKNVITAYHKLKIIDPDPSSQHFFQSLLKRIYADNPSHLIPQIFSTINHTYDGKIFCENVKISLVLPTDSNYQKKHVYHLRKLLSKTGLTVNHSNRPFADISRIPSSDSKAASARILFRYLKVHRYHSAVFGDQPEKNDRELLSISPWSFTTTRTKNIYQSKSKKPPFILRSNGSCVNAFHNAIRFLMS